jgi:hypothetical protein
MSKPPQQLDLAFGRIAHDHLPLGIRKASCFAMKAYLITQVGVVSQDTRFFSL